VTWRTVVPAVVVALSSIAVGACGDDSSDATQSSAATTPAGPATTAAPVIAPPEGIPRLRPKILETVPHDRAAFTEGFVFDEQGRLYESAGLQGKTTVREVDPATGKVVRSRSLDPAIFGEGLALVDDRLYMLSYRNGKAFVFDRETFEELASFDYEGEGWGLCYDGKRLIMSNGSDTLTFRDPETFEVQGTAAVTMADDPLRLLNELECVDGKVYANLWRSELVVLIDPESGEVESVIDASSLPRQAGANVLNGIARDPDGNMWMTGKFWDSMYRVELVPG
jgi:glutaminyl-peptide cyclotransferase